MAEKDVSIRLRATVDTQSISQAVNADQQLIDGNKRVAASYDNIIAAVNRFSPEVLRLNPELAQQALASQQAALANDQLAQSNVRVAQSYRDVATGADRAADAERTSSAQSANGSVFGLKTGFSTIRGLGSAVGTLGAGAIGGQFAAAVGLIETLGPAGLLISGAAAAISAYNAEQEASRERVQETAKALAEETKIREGLRAAIATGDTGGIAVQISELQANIRDIEDTQLTPLLSAQDTAFTQFRQQARQMVENQLSDTMSPEAMQDPGIDDIVREQADEIASANGEYRARVEEITRIREEEIAPLQTQIDQLKTLGVEGAAAFAELNRPFEEAQKLRDILKSGTVADVSSEIAILGENINFYSQQITNADSMIEQARLEGKDALADQLEIYRAQTVATLDATEAEKEFLETKGLEAAAQHDATAAAKAFADSLKDGVTDALKDAAKAAEEVNERFADARSQQYDAFIEAMDIEADLRAEITETLGKIRDIQAERDAKLRDLAEDNSERRIEIETDARDRIAQIVQQSADNVYRIMRNAGREQFAAQGRRDAEAFYESRIRQQDALEDQKTSDQRAVEQTAKTMAKQLDSQQRGFEKMERQVIATADRQIDAQQAGLTQLEVDLRNAVNSRLNIESNLNSGLQGMAVAHFNAMIGVAYQGGVDMVSALRSAFTQGMAQLTNVYSGGGGGGDIGTIQPWGGQGGGYSASASYSANFGSPSTAAYGMFDPTTPYGGASNSSRRGGAYYPPMDGGGVSPVTINIMGSKADADAIARKLKPVMEQVARGQIILVEREARALRGY